MKRSRREPALCYHCLVRDVGNHTDEQKNSSRYERYTQYGGHTFLAFRLTGIVGRFVDGCVWCLVSHGEKTRRKPVRSISDEKDRNLKCARPNERRSCRLQVLGKSSAVAFLTLVRDSK